MTTTALDITAPTRRARHSHEPIREGAARVVFVAWTTPEHLRHWWGPRHLELVGCDVDLRVGGTWRFVSRVPTAGSSRPTASTSRSTRPTASSLMWCWEGMPEDVAVETLTLRSGRRRDDGARQGVSQLARRARSARRERHGERHDRECTSGSTSWSPVCSRDKRQTGG